MSDQPEGPRGPEPDVPWWSRPEGDVWSGPAAPQSGDPWARPAEQQPTSPSGQPSGQQPGQSPWGQPSGQHSGQTPWGQPSGQQPGQQAGWSSWSGQRPPDDTLGRPPRREGPGRGALVAGALAVALIAGGAGGGIGALVAERTGETTTIDGASLGSAPDRVVSRPPGSVAAVAAKVTASVVQIRVRTGNGSGTGSGFVIRSDGYILTNNHVVAGAVNAPTVQFGDSTQTTARVVGRSASYDLAVLKVNARNLTALPLGNSDDVAVGDPVIAVGSPLGLAGTVTTGIISAKNRPVTASEDQNPGSGSDSSFINALQTDAAINPGNSGGPLVDMSGAVIGVNSAIATVAGLGSQGGNIGLGFAIPINQARRTAEQLIQTGHATHPVIGASIDGSYQGDGARIATDTGPDGQPPIVPGGPAARAGLRPGDVITAVDGQQVTSSSELIVAIRSKLPGERIVLTVQRGGSTQRITVTLGSSSE